MYTVKVHGDTGISPKDCSCLEVAVVLAKTLRQCLGVEVEILQGSRHVAWA